VASGVPAAVGARGGALQAGTGISGWPLNNRRPGLAWQLQHWSHVLLFALARCAALCAALLRWTRAYAERDKGPAQLSNLKLMYCRRNAQEKGGTAAGSKVSRDCEEDRESADDTLFTPAPLCRAALRGPGCPCQPWLHGKPSGDTCSYCKGRGLGSARQVEGVPHAYIVIGAPGTILPLPCTFTPRAAELCKYQSSERTSLVLPWTNGSCAGGAKGAMGLSQLLVMLAGSAGRWIGWAMG
jgi:hypothetical protein